MFFFFNKSFPGGVHPPQAKEKTKHKPIEKALDPKIAVIPLVQHTGAPCEPLVKVGDYVKVGQKIGDSESFISAPVHASISGKVIAIEKRPHPVVGEALAIIIESDGENKLHESIRPQGDFSSLTRDQIKAIIREAGLVGLGGAAFPTHVKLTPPPGKTIDTFILNGAECEPYLTCDERIMIERAEEIILGMFVFMKVLEVKTGYIGIEDNKPEAISSMESALKNFKGANEALIKIVPLKTKYPQGGEKQLIRAITGRIVPRGKLPFEVGVVVQNVGTALAVSETFKTGLPLIKRIVTVAGNGVQEPKNLEVKIGTLFKEILEGCKIIYNKVKKVIMGGPMMGIPQYTLDVPVIKGTTGILAFTNDELTNDQPSNCIRCGSCVESCPQLLYPLYLRQYIEKQMWDQVELHNALDCIECGVCSYVCPARIPLVQLIKIAKREILFKQKSKQ